MSKTIKIIDLLNKIANGEELPKSIKYYGFIWQLHNGNYFENGQRMLEDYLANGIVESLNDEVEIIEEQEEIDIQDIRELLELEEYEVDKTDVKLNRQVINELVQAVKQLDLKINK